MERPEHGSKVLAIDGDWVLFKIAFAALAEAKRKGKEHLSLPLTIKMLDNYLAKLNRDLNSTDYIVLLTGRNNFRKNIVYDHLPEGHKYYNQKAYKANRKGTELPPFIKDMSEHLNNHHPTYTVDNAEADDGLGVWATEHPDSTIIVAVDKDLDMIPGWHYNPTKDLQYEVTPHEALEFAAIQILTGDSVDNIPGLFACTGIRCTKAIKEDIKRRVQGLANPIMTKHKAMIIATTSAFVHKPTDSVSLFALKERLSVTADMVWINNTDESLQEGVDKYNGS